MMDVITYSFYIRGSEEEGRGKKKKIGTPPFYAIITFASWGCCVVRLTQKSDPSVINIRNGIQKNKSFHF